MVRYSLLCVWLASLVACGDPTCPAGTHYDDPRCVPDDAGPPSDGGSHADAGDGGAIDGGACLLDLCGSECVDTQSDEAHCGTCGTSCGDELCIAGECVDGVVDVAAGHYHSCALRASGTIACWGANAGGQLGDGTTDDSPVPVEVMSIDDAVELGVGGPFFSTYNGHACVRREDRTVWCWGSNRVGQLGNAGATGVDAYSSVPVRALGLDAVVELGVGDQSVCAVRDGGTVYCWGATSWGSTVTAPVQVMGIKDATQIEPAPTHTCALRRTSTVACWGLNDHGELGTGMVGVPSMSDTPLTVPDVDDAVHVDTGIGHTCVLRRGGQVACWGSNMTGALGTALPVGVGNRAVPELVENLDGVRAIDSLFLGSCAILDSGDVRCWGLDYAAEGAGTSGELRRATPVAGIADVLDVGVGSTHACAVLRDGTAACWGNNDFGQLGDGSMNGAGLPVGVSGLP